MHTPINHRTAVWEGLTPDAKQPPTWHGLARLGFLQWLWIAILIGIAALYTHFSPPLFRYADWVIFGLITIAIAGRYHALGVVLHDACHMPKLLPVRQRLALEILCGFPIATTLRAMRFHHLRHHQWSCTTADPYFKPQSAGVVWSIWLRARGLLIIPFWIARSLFGAVATLFDNQRLLTIYRVIFLQDKNLDSERSVSEAKACANDEFFQLIFFVPVGFATFFWPKALVFFYWAPVAIAGLLNAHRVIAEHRHIERTESGVESMLATTVTHKLRWPLQSVLYPLNIGYHEVHHLFPTLKLQALARANELLKTRS
jgi:fatty acid desaturase